MPKVVPDSLPRKGKWKAKGAVVEKAAHYRLRFDFTIVMEAPTLNVHLGACERLPNSFLVSSLLFCIGLFSYSSVAPFPIPAF